MKKTTTLSPEKKMTLLVAVAGIVVLLTGVWLWYQFVYSSAERTFWAMMDANLQTRGVTRHINQQSQDNSFDQRLQLELGANNVARSVTTLEQTANGASNRVVSEMIGTPNATYARYTDITTPSQADFGQLLNVWGKEEAAATSQSQSLFSEAVFGVVPFSRLNSGQRAQVMDFVRDNNVYEVDFASAQKTSVDGKRAYVYKVSVNTVAYIKLLQLIDGMMGLKQLELIDANAYANSPVIPMELSVGIDSRQLLRARYEAVQREEHFSGYGVQPQLAEPGESIDRAKLEQQLQDVLGGE